MKKTLFLLLLILPIAYAATEKCYIFTGGNVCLGTNSISGPAGTFYFANNNTSGGTADGNNYTTSISFSRLSDLITLTLGRNGMAALTASFTDANDTARVDSLNTTRAVAGTCTGGNTTHYNVTANTSATGAPTCVMVAKNSGGSTYTNGTGLLLTGSTFSLYTAYTDSLYYSILNPFGFYNSTTIPAYALLTQLDNNTIIRQHNGSWVSAAVGNYSAASAGLYTNITNLQSSNTTTNARIDSLNTTTQGQYTNITGLQAQNTTNYNTFGNQSANFTCSAGQFIQSAAFNKDGTQNATGCATPTGGTGTNVTSFTTVQDNIHQLNISDGRVLNATTYVEDANIMIPTTNQLIMNGGVGSVIQSSANWGNQSQVGAFYFVPKGHYLNFTNLTLFVNTAGSAATLNFGLYNCTGANQEDTVANACATTNLIINSSLTGSGTTQSYISVSNSSGWLIYGPQWIATGTTGHYNTTGITCRATTSATGFNLKNTTFYKRTSTTITLPSSIGATGAAGQGQVCALLLWKGE